MPHFSAKHLVPVISSTPGQILSISDEDSKFGCESFSRNRNIGYLLSAGFYLTSGVLLLGFALYRLHR